MIGLLASGAAPQEDLLEWLEDHGVGPVRVQDFDRLENAARLSGLWWHSPVALSLQGHRIEWLKNYVQQGGKLFLSRGAALLVAPLLNDVPPDTIREQMPPFFFRPGVCVEDAHHPMFEGLDKHLITYGYVEMTRFTDLAWKKSRPRRGRLLGSGLLNGAVLRDEAVCWEWALGRGRVTVFTGAALYFQHNGHAPGLLAFTQSIVNYLDMPCHLDVASPAPLLDPESYEHSRLGRYGLAYDLREPASLRVELTPFQLNDPQVRLTLTRRSRILRSTHADHLEIGAGELEPGYYTLEAEVKEEGDPCSQLSVPVLFCETESRPVRYTDEITTLNDTLEIDNESGCAKGLYSKGLNFLANETNSILEDQNPPPWFGTVMGRFRVENGSWRAFSNRSTQATLESVRPDGVHFSSRPPGLPLSIGWSFELLTDSMRWTFTLTNCGDRKLEIESLHLPASLNTFFGYQADQERIYAKRVMMHNLICGRGSYLFAEPLQGTPPYLLVLPRFDEGLDRMWHDQENLRGRQPAWEGLLYVGIPSLVLEAGQSKRYPLDLVLLEEYAEINAHLVEADLPAYEPHPGMVVPVDMPSSVTIQSRLDYGLELPEGVSAKKKRDRFELGFDAPGLYTIKVVTGKGESLYHHRVIPPLEALIKARSAFIAEKQQYRNPSSERDHAFLMWDAEEQAMVTNPEHAYLAGGSDEACLADPVFLSAKQIFFPEEKEMEALERYVERFLYGRVQDRASFAVRRWVSEKGVEAHAVEGHDIGAWTDRSFNYPHVFNIYYALYAAGTTRICEPREYLERAAKTVLAYFAYGKCLNAAVEQGNIGDCALPLILEALEAEGLGDLTDRVRRAMAPKIEYLTKAPRPYASEYSFDTTGYEGVYWIRTMAGDTRGVQSVLSTILGTRGKQPSWYHYGGDVRWGWGNSKLTSPDEICFNYMCGLNARVLLHAYLNVAPNPWWRKLGFAGTVAPWALVEPDGTAHDFCGWEPGRELFDAWSSEMGLGIASSLFALMSLVILQPGGDPLGYGCRIEMKERTLCIEPCDGVRRRLAIRSTSGEGIHLLTDHAPIQSARCHLDELWMELKLEGEAAVKVRSLGRVKREEVISGSKLDLSPFLPHGFQ